MDDLNNTIELKGKSARVYQFVHCYNLAENEQPGNAGIFVFAKKKSDGSATVLDIQLLLNEDEITSTVHRVKEDGAIHAFWKECNNELSCDAEIDDIKQGEDYRRMIE